MTIVRRTLAPTATSVGAQPVDADLTTIAGLTAATDNFMQAKSSAWASRTPTQVAADLVTPLAASLQPLDADLTAIGALDSTVAGVLATDGAGWTRKTYSAMRTALDGNLLTAGEATLNRDLAFTTTLATVSGNLRLVYFDARKTETTTQVRVLGGGTAAAATPTLVQFALYQIDATGAGTLVASTTNDTTLFSAATTVYTKSWTTPFAKVAGQRYAFGQLVVSGAATPTMCGVALGTVGAAEALMAPARTGLIASQATLPASFAAGAPTASAALIYAAILP